MELFKKILKVLLKLIAGVTISFIGLAVIMIFLFILRFLISIPIIGAIFNFIFWVLIITILIPCLLISIYAMGEKLIDIFTQKTRY